MTLWVTVLGRRAKDMGRVARQIGDKKLLYTLDHAHLLSLYSVIRLFGEIRDAEDPSARSEILTEAQRRVADFISELRPLALDQIRRNGQLSRSA